MVWKDLRQCSAANRSSLFEPDTCTYKREPFSEAKETRLVRMRPGHEWQARRNLMTGTKR